MLNLNSLIEIINRHFTGLALPEQTPLTCACFFLHTSKIKLIHTANENRARRLEEDKRITKDNYQSTEERRKSYVIEANIGTHSSRR